MMLSLIPVEMVDDILPRYRGTSVEHLLRYHNLGEPMPATTGKAEVLVGMCMDHREELRVPNEFAYELRVAGGRMGGHEFEISYAVSVARVAAIVLIAHTDCGMAHVTTKRGAFVRGLVEWGGCGEEDASRLFAKHAANYEIGDPAQFIVSEAARIQRFYPNVMVAPLLYAVEDDRLRQITDDAGLAATLPHQSGAGVLTQTS
jgi:carbonic anhydrase